MAFLRFLDMTPSEAHTLHRMPLLRKRLQDLKSENENLKSDPYILFVLLQSYLFRSWLTKFPVTINSCQTWLKNHVGYLSAP